jgi:hypothetical protein
MSNGCHSGDDRDRSGVTSVSNTATAFEETGMNPGASCYGSPPDKERDHGVAWASVVAILFAAVAAISFAVDQSVTLSNLPAASPAADAER